MEFSNCNLYITGNRKIEQNSFKRAINEFIFFETKSSMDLINGSDWIIRTENIHIDVEIKEYEDIGTHNVPLIMEKKDNIILYILDGHDRKIKNSNLYEEVQKLKVLSERSTIIIVPTIRPHRFKNKISLNYIRKHFPFVEYIFSINDLYNREFEKISQIVHFLRQLIINSHTSSLNYAKEIIKNNFESKDPNLDLGNLGLTSLNDVKELFQNTHLKTLILSNEWGEYQDGSWKRRISKNKLEPNILFELPKEIANLKNLEVLIAGGNWKNSKIRKRLFYSNWHVNDLTAISRLKKLSILNLSNNAITRTYPISRLSNLTQLYLNNNQITLFPNISKFPQLKKLYLSNNKIRKVTFLSSIETRVKTIDLHSNNIKDLTPIKHLISKINIKDSKWENDTISIAFNPLSIPPIEVVAQGRKNVISYFSKLEAEQEIQIKPFDNADLKLILVGNSNVGKSTFVNWLKTGIVDKTITTTHWLNLGVWTTKRGNKNYTIRIFDFGGQEYYHDTHHLFFTNRTAYTLLWDQQSNKFDEIEIEQKQDNGQKKFVKIETFPLEYWLDSIRYHTQKRNLTKIEKSISKILHDREQQIEKSIRIRTNRNEPNRTEDQEKIEENILILQNKVDTRESKIFLNEEKLSSNYPKIYDFEHISLFSNKRLELSKNTLFDIFDSLEILNRQFLGTWNYIKQDIEKQEFNDSFSLNDFLKYCNDIIRNLPELKNKPSSQQQKVLFSMHDAKVFASFLADIGLCLYYPEDIKDKVFLNQNQILKNLNHVLQSINKTTGEISESDISKTLNKPEGSDEIKDIISLMLHFKILFKHPLIDKNSFVAPLYLPQTPPKSIELFQSLFKKPVYRFQYETFIHKSIVLDFFHTYGSKALSETSDDSSFYFWKNGIVLKDDTSNEIVMVKFSPWNNEENCAYLNIYTANGTKDKFINTIVKHIDSINHGINVKKLVPDDSFHEYIPLDIIHQNEEEQNSVFHFKEKYYHLTSFKKYLKTPPKMKKIFISYSKQDLRLVNKFIEHLSALKKDGKVSKWYCSQLEAGSVWNDEIQKRLDESDIVCFMISSSFMKTEYIHEHEIKKAFERKAIDPDFKIIPIILNFCHWTTKKNNLGQFTALPYSAKPIMDIKNQDMAWYVIVECLRLIIDKDTNPTNQSYYADNLPKEVLEIYNRIVEGKVDNNSI